jgi:glycerol-3-phosphate acyltransferase PlsY
MDYITLISIPLAYIIGSISSAYIVAKLNGRIDVRDEPDGKISAAAVYRRVGLLSFLMVVFLDIGKTALAVLIPQWLQASPEVVLAAGFAAVAGHQWSIFLRFQGGLGATAIAGVLAATVTIPTLIGAGVAAMMAWRTKRSSMSFAVGMTVIAIIIFTMQYSKITPLPIYLVFPPPPLLVAYPILLGLMQILKALQVKFRPGAPIKVK